jgi:hypothetical protein
MKNHKSRTAPWDAKPNEGQMGTLGLMECRCESYFIGLELLFYSRRGGFQV